MQRAKRIAGQLQALWMLIAVCIVLSIATPVFATTGNLLNVALATSVTALLAIGQTFVIILAEIDLSVGSVLGFSAAVTALVMQHQPAFVAMIIGLATGAAIGFVNGIFVTKTRMPSFIVTLAMLSVMAGLALQITQGNPISVASDTFLAIGQGHLLGIPVPVWIMAVAFVAFGILLARTRFGRYIYATGDNPEAAKLSGIPTDRVKIAAFVISGALAALAGFIITARLSTAEPTAGSGMELEAIAAVIIGGTSLLGGRGNMLGTVVGAFILGVIDNGMNLLNVSPFLQDVVKGIVILIAVLLDRNASVIRTWFTLRPATPAASPPAGSPPAGPHRHRHPPDRHPHQSGRRRTPSPTGRTRPAHPPNSRPRTPLSQRPHPADPSQPRRYP